MNRIFQHISYHLLSSVTIAFILGIASTPFLHLNNFFPVFSVIVLCFFLVVVTILHHFSKFRTVLLLLLLLFFFLGANHAQLQSSPPSAKNHIWNAIGEKQEAVIVGTLAAMPGFNGKTSRLQVAVQFMRLSDWHNLTPIEGNILLRMEGALSNQFFPGDTLVIRADLKRPTSFLSPGSFDFSQYLARQDIWITGFIRSPLFLRKLSHKSSFLNKLRYFPEKVRNAIGREIDTRVSPQLSGLYRAILLGDRSGVSHTVLEQFKASGAMHILAISGIHMSVIGTLLFVLFYRTLSLSQTMLLNFNVRKMAVLFCLPLLIFYSMLAGLNSPVIRSVIMSTVVIAGICIDRKKSVSELLFFAAFLILTISPLQLFTASFQLSFTAVAAILFILPTLKQLLITPSEEKAGQTAIYKVSTWLTAGLLVSTVATFATAPLALYYFNRLSLIGPVTNIILEPLICLWSLTCGVIAIPFLFFIPEVGDFFLQIGSYGLQVSLNFVHFCSSFTYSDFRLPTPPLWLIFLYYLFFLLVTLQAGRKKRLTFLAMAPFCIVIILFFYLPNRFITKQTRPFTISFLDVGQGSSTLLEFPSGFRVLIDGGGSSYLSTMVGERVIAPYLWKNGISRIDAIIVTHPDADHYNGLPFIVEHFSPSTVWLNSFTGHDTFFEDFLQQIENKGAASIIAADDQQLRQQPELLHCIANTTRWREDESARDSGRKENSGLIVKACAKDLCLLFPGDIGEGAEHALVEKGYALHANILLSPHHGSATSNSEQFLKAVKPEHMVVSSGKGKKNIFPHPDLDRLCSVNGINLLQTAQYGTIEIVSASKGYKIYGYQKYKNNPLAKLSRHLIAEIGLN